MARDIFLKYLEATRNYTVAAEQASIKVSPEKKGHLQDAFRLQLLFNERDTLRFEYLLSSDALPDILAMKSIYTISDRLRQGWTDVEEAGLKEQNSTYIDVLSQIEDLRRKLDSSALEEPLNAVRNDSDYRGARQLIADQIQEFQEQLSRL